MALGLLTGACQSDRTDDTDEGGDFESSSQEPSPVTHPFGDEPAAVTPYVSELLLVHDRVVNQIVADPGVARNPDDPLIEEFFGVFELDDDLAGEVLDGWVERADEGLRTEPFDDAFPSVVSTLDGDVETVSAYEVSFSVCSIHRYRVYDSDGSDGDGEVVQEVPRQDQAGSGIAVRVHGQWRLRELNVSPVSLECRSDEG